METTALPPGDQIMPQLFVAALVVLALFAPATALAAKEPDPEPCEAGEDLAMDFWIGEWAVFDAAGNAIATSRVEALNGNCLLRERRTQSNREVGTSTSYFDPTSGRWRQLWIFADGRILQLESRAEDGEGLHFEGEVIGRNGLPHRARAALTHDVDTVRLVVEVAGEIPEAWEVVDELSFRRPATSGPVGVEDTATPVAMADPAAPTAAPAAAPIPPKPEPLGDVTEDLAVRSREVTGPKHRKLDATLESPMIFELKMGSLVDLPAGYGWSSTQTAGYECEGASIRKVSATPVDRRKNVQIRLVVGLTGSRMSQEVGLLVELLSDGEVIAQEQRGEISIGRLVPANRDDGVPVKLSFELDHERFEAVFGASSQPVLRLTLDCGG